MEKDSGSLFLKQALRPRDQAVLLSFDVNLNLLQDYTNNSETLIRALNKAEINGDGGVPATKDTHGIPDPVPVAEPPGAHFYDAIYLAADKKLNQETGRKAMIVLSDGEDQDSSFTSQDVIAEAEKNNIAVFVIWSGGPKCFDPKNRRMPWQPKTPGENKYPLPDYQASQAHRSQGDGRDECAAANWKKAICPGYFVAKCISEHTGGKFIIPQNGFQLERAFKQIEDDLRSHYWATYLPSDTRADGRFHRIEIQCSADDGESLKVQMRRGYYADTK